MAGAVIKIDQESYSKQNMETINFAWTIDNFPNLKTPYGEYISSGIFQSKDYAWFLRLYPNPGTYPYYQNRDVKHIWLTLNVVKVPLGTSVDTDFKFHILNSENRAIFGGTTQQIKHSFGSSSYWKWGPGYSCSNKMSLIIFGNYVIDRKLKIGIELNIVKDFQTFRTRPDNIKATTTNMIDFSDYFAEQKFTDVVIEAKDGKTIRAHKLILAKNSPVFDRMFSTQMKEAGTNRVEIKNYTAGVLDKLLKFMYSGKLENIDNAEMHKELIKAADQYEVLPLKKHSESVLCEKLSLTLETVIPTLEFASMFQCPDLKDAALRFILMNKDNILNTEEWKEFLRQNPDVAQEFICKIVNVTLKRKFDQVEP